VSEERLHPDGLPASATPECDERNGTWDVWLSHLEEMERRVRRAEARVAFLEKEIQEYAQQQNVKAFHEQKARAEAAVQVVDAARDFLKHGTPGDYVDLENALTEYDAAKGKA
jgi:hypothetical protein